MKWKRRDRESASERPSVPKDDGKVELDDADLDRIAGGRSRGETTLGDMSLTRELDKSSTESTVSGWDFVSKSQIDGG